MMDCSTDLRYFAIRANTPKKILQSRNKKCQDHKVTNHGRPDRRYGLVRSGFLTRNFIWSGTRSGFWSATFFRTKIRTPHQTRFLSGPNSEPRTGPRKSGPRMVRFRYGPTVHGLFRSSKGRVIPQTT